jgi:hypothetical protein
MWWNWHPTLKPTIDMLNIDRAGTGRMPGRHKTLSIFRLVLGLFFCAVLWVMTNYRLGSYFDRAHSGGSRIYRVNSYEQFMKEKAGDGAFLMA